MIEAPHEEYLKLTDDDPTIQLVDWKDSPGTVFDHVDYLLAAHGLQLKLYDTKADCYMFAIVRRD
jgi:hypothetical protein